MGSEQLATGKKYCSRDDLRQVFANSYDAIFVIDGKGNVILCNPATGKLLDVNPQELVGRNVMNLVKEGIYSPSIAWQVIEKREVVTGLLRNRHGDKVLCTGTPIFDANGEVSMVIINSR
ncbi:MAG: PAS domain-containing protein, partial [Syntrophomonadaceae bacterium]